MITLEQLGDQPTKGCFCNRAGVVGGLWAASKRWTGVCDYFSICSFVIYTDSKQIKRSCCIWQNSPSCTINSREGHLLLSNLCYIKAALIVHPDWQAAGLQWQMPAGSYKKKLTDPTSLSEESLKIWGVRAKPLATTWSFIFCFLIYVPYFFTF